MTAIDNKDQLTLTKGDLRLLLREAVALALAGPVAAGAIGPEITQRPYQTIKHPTEQNDDGTAWVVSPHPDAGGPIAINGQHPDDYFEVDDRGYATVNAPGQQITTATPAPEPAFAAIQPSAADRAKDDEIAALKQQLADAEQAKGVTA